MPSNVLLRCLLLVLLAVGLSSCSRSDRFRLMERRNDEARVPMKVAVPNFSDSRGYTQNFNRTMSKIPIIGLWAGYHYDRHDEVHSGTVEPFSRLLAEGLAERLREVGAFDEVSYYPAGRFPERGEYDLVIHGHINELQIRGALLKYGFSNFSGLLWWIGLPRVSRRWLVDVDYQVLDGYRMQPISDTKKVELSTRHRFYTTYANQARVNDLKNRIEPVYDEFLDWFWETQPAGDAEYWAELREGGRIYLAELRLEEEQARMGTPPTFSFLSPSDGEVVRAGSVNLRWSINAPGALKSAALVRNGQSIALGIDTLSLLNPESAPRTVPAREATVALDMGRNHFEALVTDHRGNETRAEFEVHRLPGRLEPAARFALLIASGDDDEQGVADTVKDVLVDPYLGQFADDDVYTLKTDGLTRAKVQQAVQDFGRRPLAGQLAVVYIRANGNWGGLELGDGTVTLTDMITLLEGSLATSEVILLCDINWSGGGDGGDLIGRLENLPGRWAFLTTQTGGGRSPDATIFANAVAGTMRGSEGSTRRLTLERFLDGILNVLDGAPGLNAESYGRYERSISMVERE